MAFMASIMTKVLAGLNYGSVQRNKVGHISRLPHINLQVKCILQEPEPPFIIEGVSRSSSTQVRTKVEFVIELATGRAAMLGFLSAIAVQALTRRDFWSQLYGGGAEWLAVTETITLVGTLVPSLQGISLSGPLFTTTAELLNGPIAMVGLVGLAINEYVRGGPLL